MGLKGLLAVLLLVCTFFTGAAQQYNYRHYTTREGLPSMVAYEVAQDKQGFIWIATKDGLCKFDGYRFKTFTTEDGLPDNEIIGVQVGPDGKVWAFPFRSRLAYIENDTVYLPEKVKEKELPVRRFEIDPRGHLWITRINGTITEYNDSIINTYNPNEGSLLNTSSYAGNADSNGVAWLACDSLVVRIDTLGKIKKWAINNKQYAFNTARLLSIAPSGNIYLFNSLALLRFMTDSTQVIFDNEIAGYNQDFKIMNLTIASNEDLLVATSQGAFSISINADGTQVIEQFLEGKSIGKVIEDSEGNLWFCTLTDGVYMLSAASRRVTNIGKENGLFNTMPGSIFVYNGTLGVSSNYGDVYSIKYANNKFEAIPESFSVFSENLNNCVQIHGHGTWCGSNSGLNVFPAGANLSFDNWNLASKAFEPVPSAVFTSKDFNLLNFSTVKAVAIEPLRDGKIWVAAANGLFVVDPYANERGYTITKVYFNRASAVAFDGNGVLWASLLEGLYYWQRDTLIRAAGYDIQALASSMHYASDSIMWIGSPKGLFGFSGINDKKPIHFTTKTGLPSNIVNHIIEMPAGLIVATDKGICLVQDTGKRQYKIIPLQINDGLISKEVRQTIAWQDKLVALTSKGVSIIDTSQIGPDKTYPKVYFTLVNIAGKDTAVRSQYTLPYTQNSFKLEYVGLSYKSDGDIVYQYQLEGIDTGWTQTAFTNVQYPFLAPGKYRFKIDARSLQGAWSGKPVAIDFTILPPYWQTTWFRMFMVFLFLATVIGISYAIIRYYRKQSEIAQRMAQLEGQALRAQMNPHFVFNALNAIHDFIANSDERSAHMYLGKFAKLIRKILDQSRKAEISLAQEIETLELYIELEALRFPGRFECYINCPNDLLKQDIYIPPMLVQPYIENAIRHGLMNNEKRGVLEVTFERDGKALKVTVQDDGVGRKKAMEISSHRLKQHQSAAMEITKHRLSLQNVAKPSGECEEVSIEDLYDANEQPIGTKVTFWITLETT